jgi:hypothetical protein
MVPALVPPWLAASLAHGMGGVAVVLSGGLTADRFAVFCAAASWFAAMLLAGWKTFARGQGLSFLRAAILGLLAGILAHALFLAASFTFLGQSHGSTMMEQFGNLVILVLAWLPLSLALYAQATLLCALCMALLLGFWQGEPPTA